MNATQIDRFDLEQRLLADQKCEHGGYGIVCTTHRGIQAHEASKKLYAIGDLATGKHLFTGNLKDAVDRFLSLQ